MTPEEAAGPDNQGDLRVRPAAAVPARTWIEPLGCAVRAAAAAAIAALHRLRDSLCLLAESGHTRSIWAHGMLGVPLMPGISGGREARSRRQLLRHAPCIAAGKCPAAIAATEEGRNQRRGGWCRRLWRATMGTCGRGTTAAFLNGTPTTAASSGLRCALLRRRSLRGNGSLESMQCNPAQPATAAGWSVSSEADLLPRLLSCCSASRMIGRRMQYPVALVAWPVRPGRSMVSGRKLSNSKHYRLITSTPCPED